MIVFCNSMFRSRNQEFGIRGTAYFANVTGSDRWTTVWTIKTVERPNCEPGISARFFLLSVAFIALDDSVTLDSNLGVQLSGLVIATPLLKDLILLSERG